MLPAVTSGDSTVFIGVLPKMPTIDQLAPATATSDSDELVVSQGGTVRKATRAQVISGLQSALAVSSGKLLGRASSGVGGVEQVTVGANLVLSQGTLAATAAPFVVSGLPAGTVPSGNDLVSMGQGGTNTAVPYSQFMNGLSGLSNLDASQMLLRPTGSSSSDTIAGFAAGALRKTGGTMSGPLSLAGDPTAGLQAATKQYVDGQVGLTLPLSGGVLTGPLTLGADPVGPLQAATKEYVDSLGLSLSASGAKGDGVTDDTAAINGFLAGLQPGQRVWVPVGKFYLINSGNLTIPTGVVIQGTAPLSNQANNALFCGCGFLLNPGYCVALGYAAQLRNLKIFRSGLLPNPTAAQVSSAVTTWASEVLTF
jgi:hypothetical protein